MGDDHCDILSEAVARNSAAVLSLPSAGMLRHCKSRFLAQSADGLWIESAPEEASLIDDLLLEKTAVGISFKYPPNKATFVSSILRRDPSFPLNANAFVEALLLQNPAKVKQIQRRSNYRVRVPDGAPLAIRAWRIADHVPVRDRPLASMLIDVTPRDLSVGGMGVTVRFAADEQKLRSGQRLRVEVKYDEIELILEGVLRLATAEPSVKTVKGGVQFKKLENDLAGRQAMAALTRIVGEFQRDEVRRGRMGL